MKDNQIACDTEPVQDDEGHLGDFGLIIEMQRGDAMRTIMVVNVMVMMLVIMVMLVFGIMVFMMVIMMMIVFV